MAFHVQIGDQLFLEEGGEEIGAVRKVAPDHLVVYVEAAGDFTVPGPWVRAVHDGKVIVATDVGVFTSSGNGRWSHLGSDLPDGVVARDIWLDPTGRYLVVSLFGRGIWQFDFGSGARGSNSPDEDDGGDRGGLAATGLSPGNAALGLGLVLAAAVAWSGARRRGRDVTEP